MAWLWMKEPRCCGCIVALCNNVCVGNVYVILEWCGIVAVIDEMVGNGGPCVVASNEGCKSYVEQ